MTVAELIEQLQTYPQNLQVAYCLYSEMTLLEDYHIDIVTACEPRPDGWIQRQRPDKQTQDYLCFPGN